MVINRGTNDQYFIFRGQDGRDFLRGLAIDNRQPVRLVLLKDRRVNGTLYLTKAATFALEIPTDDLNDRMAELVFDLTVERYFQRALLHHDRN